MDMKLDFTHWIRI